MTAEEARKKAEARNIEDGQYAQIIKMISNCANKGEYEMWYYDHIKPEVRAKLTKDGFLVKDTQYEKNEVMTLIKW